MSTRTWIYVLLGGAVLYWLAKNNGVISSPQSQTSKQNGGTQTPYPQDDFQAATQAISSLFATGLAAINGGVAQTAPKSL